MEELKIVVPGCPVTKKNSQRIVTTKAGRSFIIPSKKYKEYEKTASSFMPRLDKPISTPINIRVLYYMETRRRVDLTNLLEATDDILVNFGIIADDNFRIVAGHDGSRVYHDKECPRAEIFITDMEE